ncbi:MAG: cobalamin-independent methionine synthase II family protein [Chloroflexi bacterium]|nr:cobalamin-independent methionine synthase II family protein [Chloroflexota bacterium]
MKRSTDRILTTHTGSLPRPGDLVSMVEGRDQQELRDNSAFEQRVKSAVREVVRQQADSHVDVINDGEVSKVGYSTYITERLTGFEGTDRPSRPQVEVASFPEFYEQRPTGGAFVKRPVCTGPITWHGDALVRRDIDNLKAALQGVPAADQFMTAASPGVVWNFLENDYYKDDEAYVFAVADAMKHEYRAIVDAGFVLQLDAPDLAMGWNRYVFKDSSIEDFRSVAEMHVDAMNHALQDIPSDRVRLHLCWGNFEGPHVRDIPLARILDIALKTHAQALSFEGANPRHEHEWKVFKDQKLPDGTILIPGVLDSTTNFVEHPELIAERITRYADVVGRENVMAGTDCGFSTFARSQLTVHPSVTWAKFEAMAEGARLASEQLWG